MEVNVRREDMRNIRISCKDCGEGFVTEVPEPLSGVLTLTLCPKCRKPFGIWKDGETWKVKAIQPGQFMGRVAAREEEVEEIRRKWQQDRDDRKEEQKDEPKKKPFVN